jgi:hypothetical protein
MNSFEPLITQITAEFFTLTYSLVLENISVVETVYSES